MLQGFSIGDGAHVVAATSGFGLGDVLYILLRTRFY